MAWCVNNGAPGMVILCFWKQKSRDYPAREYATGEIPEAEVPRLAGYFSK